VTCIVAQSERLIDLVGKPTIILQVMRSGTVATRPTAPADAETAVAS
jgi:hypothetical protein